MLWYKKITKCLTVVTLFTITGPAWALIPPSVTTQIQTRGGPIEAVAAVDADGQLRVTPVGGPSRVVAISTETGLSEVFVHEGKLFGLGRPGAGTRQVYRLNLHFDPGPLSRFYAGLGAAGVVTALGAAVLVDHAIGSGSLVQGVLGACLAFAGSGASLAGSAGWRDLSCQAGSELAHAPVVGRARGATVAAIARDDAGRIKDVYVTEPGAEMDRVVIGLRGQCELGLDSETH